jgi:FdhD protein
MVRPEASTTEARLWRVERGRAEPRPDLLATEEPLEIRLRWPGGQRTLAVTMRTPGSPAPGTAPGATAGEEADPLAGPVSGSLASSGLDSDAELALGFLYSEGVIAGAGQVADVVRLDANILEVVLGEGPEPRLASLERHFFASSACGVCGKAGLKTLVLRADPPPPGPILDPAVVCSLPERLRAAQGVFAETGGLHAAALFDPGGSLLALREDVGRHNALDKLVGWALHADALPLADRVVLVSGRSSYEILQKCAVAGVPVVCAVSAPSSLAVEVAQGFGITLIGFLRGDRFNVYSGFERLARL